MVVQYVLIAGYDLRSLACGIPQRKDPATDPAHLQHQLPSSSPTSESSDFALFWAHKASATSRPADPAALK